MKKEKRISDETLIEKTKDNHKNCINCNNYFKEKCLRHFFFVETNEVCIDFEEKNDYNININLRKEILLLKEKIEQKQEELINNCDHSFGLIGRAYEKNPPRKCRYCGKEIYE